MRVPTWIAAVTVVALIQPGILMAQPTPLETATQLEAQAKAAEQAGRTNEAFALYLKAAQALPAGRSAQRTSQKAALFELDIRLRGLLATFAPTINAPSEAAAAERFTVRGKALFDAAKTSEDFRKAMWEFEEAVRAAPWSVEHAFNLALVQEKLGYHKAAAANLNLYAESDAQDAADARRKSYELELRREDKQAALLEDCDYFHIGSACFALGLQEMRATPKRVIPPLRLNDACFFGVANACLEYGRDFLRLDVETNNQVMEVNRRIGERHTPMSGGFTDLGLKALEQSCSGGVAEGCRELGAFFSKDWPQLVRKKDGKTAALWYQRACDLDPAANKADCEQAKRVR